MPSLLLHHTMTFPPSHHTQAQARPKRDIKKTWKIKEEEEQWEDAEVEIKVVFKASVLDRAFRAYILVIRQVSRWHPRQMFSRVVTRRGRRG